MTEDTITVEKLQEMQKEKTDRYLERQAEMQAAKARLGAAKDDLILFNSKYGRVLEVMKEV